MVKLFANTLVSPILITFSFAEFCIYLGTAVSKDEQFINETRDQINSVFSRLGQSMTEAADRNKLKALGTFVTPGKMLRSHLALALASEDNALRQQAIYAAAATELIHTATLFHDDVIDGASVRRKQASLWKAIGPNGAILLGDLFYSSAMEMLLQNSKHRISLSFASTIRELCEVELEHELFIENDKADFETAIHLARGKTGTLFALAAESCADESEEQQAAYREAGYLIGAAYQLADDLMDESGNEEEIGKTLGTDRARNKFTLVQEGWTKDDIIDCVSRLCTDAISNLEPWPEQKTRLEQYIVQHLLPSWDLHLEKVG